MPIYELFCGFTSALLVSPVMTTIDTSIIKSQLTKKSFKQSFTETINDFTNKKIAFNRPFGIMFCVYSSTYSTANITELYCRKKEIDYKIPTLFTTSAVNIATIAYKDREYAKLFNQTYNVFPKKSYVLFTVRDMLTISSSFIFKKDVISYFDKYMPHNTADFIASMIVPIAIQPVSTPIHILAIDIYQRPEADFMERVRNIRNMYGSVCIGRTIRVIPAFCIGGFINDMLRNR